MDVPRRSTGAGGRGLCAGVDAQVNRIPCCSQDRSRFPPPARGRVRDGVSSITIGALVSEAALAERVDYIKREAADRFDEIELAFGFFQTSLDDPTDMRIIEMLAPEATDAERRAMAPVLDGSIAAATDRIARMREQLGISYFQFSVITDAMSTSWHTLDKLVTAVKA